MTFYILSHWSLTYNCHLYVFIFACDPLWSFSLFHGTGECSIVFRLYKTNTQAAVGYWSESSRIYGLSSFLTPRNLWTWFSISTTAYNARRVRGKGLLDQRLLSKSCC